MKAGLVILDAGVGDPDGRENRVVPLVETVVVRLPKAFYDDHVMRDLIAGNVEKETSREYHVRLDRVAYDELISDAEYYATMSRMGAFEPEMLGLASSAKATLRRLRAAETPWSVES